MAHHYFLFDMDGILLEPAGYQQALLDSVKRIGKALGAPKTTITKDQIARFEALNITNEWDTLAICAALTLVHLWHFESSIRLDGLKPKANPITYDPPDFDAFLMGISDGGHLPGGTAYQFLINHYPWLDVLQRDHLAALLENCRDIFHSLTLPAHQETVLGSRTFEEHYKLKAQLNTDSYLANYDRPAMTEEKFSELRDWLEHPEHHAGILTNRPSRTPPGFLSAPEAELGIKLIDLEHLPYVGSGILGWFAVNHCQLPDHTLLKPNPVHTLTLLQRCLGLSMIDSLQSAANLWRGSGVVSDWKPLENANIVIFEDSVKGLMSGQSACDLITKLGIKLNLTLVGISTNPIKVSALNQVRALIFDHINQIDWFEIASW